ncbi:hypothetical protein Y026_5615 [Burkholderia pseudomallei TSV28]|nr:hypothetical protein Y026_5615 [Burkholderia pseudomallei TSV28]
MAKPAFQHVRHRFEATVRMIGRAFRIVRRVIDGPHFVEQQERIEIRQQAGRKRTVNHEAAAFRRAVRRVGTLDRAGDSHGRLLE